MAPKFFFDPGVLQVGINASSQAVTNMTTVKQKVWQLTDQIKLVNDSGSGGLLTTKFSEWNHSFEKLVTELDRLNAKVIATRVTNTQASDDANTTAGS
ncbi:hypothetical protein [Saccharopolyspora elongata]|uniref:Uncharacterized protein n=1 Tax=Saccharopolyspora elongata TaxID=2530387 RepID=A0A4R4Y518_9PSEU|nr:hypothetical protein [Saccharopolyspora elongata]TDD39313.1 hypothetical protein E1288_37235 [Saccharopolyspora elongata]